MLKHRRAITNGTIPLNVILRDVERTAVYPISARHRELEVAGAINLATAPGISNQNLMREGVEELAIIFQIAPAPFQTKVGSFRVFVRGESVIAIGFATNSVPRLRELIKGTSKNSISTGLTTRRRLWNNIAC